MAVGGYSLFVGNEFGGSGEQKNGGFFSAVMQYGGYFFAVSAFLFFGGNVNVNPKHGCNCSA